MAIVSKLNEEEEEKGGMDVLSESGTSKQPQQKQQSTSKPAPVNVSGGPSAMIGQGQTTQATADQTKGKTKGSGMFTDVTKYAKANAPQSKALSGAIQQDVQKDVSQIGQKVQEQQKTYQQRVAEQRARQQQASNFAQQQLQQAQTTGNVQKQDVSKFRDLITGEQQFTDVGNLGIAQQDLAAKKLARKAAMSERATGASNLLRDTFGNQRYTRGQQSLDSLILGADRDARAGLTENLQQQAQGLTGTVRGARQQALADASRLRIDQENFQNKLQEDLLGAKGDLDTDISTSVEDAIEAMSNKQSQFRSALEQGTLTEDQLREFIDQEQIKKYQAQRQKEMDYAKGALYSYLGDREQALASGIGDVGYWLNRRYGDEYLASNLFNPNAGIGWKGEGSGFASKSRELLQNYGYDQADVVNHQQQYLQNYVENLQNERKSQEDAIYKEVAQRNQNANPDYIEYAAQQQIRKLPPVPTSADNLPSNVRQELYAESIQDLVNQVDISEDRMYSDMLEAVKSGQGKEFLDLLKLNDPEKLITRETEVTDQQIARQRALAQLAGRAGEGVLERKERTNVPGRFDLIKALQNYRKI